jgi:hypothetical protein
VDGGEAQRVGNDELAERTRELGFRGLAYKAQPLDQLHEKMSCTLDGIAPPNVDKVLDNHRFVTGRSPQSAAPRRGNSVTHFMTCVPSTGLTTASVKAEKE